MAISADYWKCYSYFYYNVASRGRESLPTAPNVTDTTGLDYTDLPHSQIRKVLLIPNSYWSHIWIPMHCRNRFYLPFSLLFCKLSGATHYLSFCWYLAHWRLSLEVNLLALSWQITASRLLLSKQTIPHYYLTVDTCVDKLVEWASAPSIS